MATYSISGVGRITVNAQALSTGRAVRECQTQAQDIVRRSSNGLLYTLRSSAPVKTGQLRSGIIPSPSAERSASPYKTVFDVYMDERKNSVFVKYTKSGKRYYYPASQEFGFRTRAKVRTYKRKRRRSVAVRVPGKNFMRNSSVSFYPEHTKTVQEALDGILKEVNECDL